LEPSKNFDLSRFLFCVPGHPHHQRSAEKQSNATKVYEKVFEIFIVMMKSNILWKYVWNIKQLIN